MAYPTGLLVAFTMVVAAAGGCLQPLQQTSSAPYDIIRDTPYNALVVEIDYADGHRPDQAAIDLLSQRMNERLNKPGGIQFVTDSFTPTKSVYSNSDLAGVRDRVKTNEKGGHTMVFHILYLNGNHAEDTSEEKVLGVHYDAASVVVFKESITRSGGGLLGLSARNIERAVLVHEFGHAIGLVDNGIPMVNNHEDPDHQGHSSNQDSVMYWAVERSNALDVFGSSIPNQFDSNDIADIRNAGGK